jgi:hypothetical protein
MELEGLSFTFVIKIHLIEDHLVNSQVVTSSDPKQPIKDSACESLGSCYSF